MSRSPDPRRTPVRESPDEAILLGRRFRQSLENVSMIALALDHEGRITFANDFLLELTGWSRKDIVGEDWFTWFVPDPEPNRQVFLSGLESGSLPTHYENEIVTRDRSLRLIAWSNTILVDDYGRVEGTVSLGADVTEERRAAAVLRGREEHFRSLIEHAADVIAILAPDGSVLYASPSIERLLDWKPEELAGKFGYSLVHEDDRALFEQTFAAILRGEAPVATEFRLRHRDGSWRNMEGIGRRHRRDDGWVIVANYRDVTDQRQLREQLAHGQKLEAVGRLAGGIAHDFNNLLTVIGGYSEILFAGFDDDDSRRDDAYEIVRAADRASLLTRQLLAFSRRAPRRTEVLDLGEVVATLETLLTRLIGDHVELVSDAQPDCWVDADRSQLEQVITNLAVNARDAMPRGGLISVLVRRDGDEAELLVGDNGTGMSSETLAHLFEPFFTTKEPGKGTGLGLATVYGIVTQSGGTISVTSELGIGTIFRVLLPLCLDESRGSERDATVLPSPVGSECILLAEDEQTIRRLVTEVLIRDGYAVHSAGTGHEALEQLERYGSSIDLLVTDVVMPGMSGPELAREAQRRFPALRVLFTSGYAREPDEALDDPDLHFIDKPFSPQAFVAKVRGVLDAD